MTKVFSRSRLILMVSALLSAVAVAEPGVPLKVFVLSGQSNMQGHAAVRTFDHMAMSEESAALLMEMRGPDGEPRVSENVWISSLGSAEEVRQGKLGVGYGAAGGEEKIGPEFAFGIFMQKQLNEPILLIKTAWGGRSLHTDFRPPSAGVYEFSAAETARLIEQGEDLTKIKAERAAASGESYRQMIAHVEKVLGEIPSIVPGYDEQAGYELAGFVWFQGWNDMVDGGVYPQRDQPGGYGLYTDLLADLVRDVRNDLDAPEMPVVVGVMGVGGPTADYDADQQGYAKVHQEFRDAMAAVAKMPEFQGNVVNVLTEECWDQELTRLRAKEALVARKRTDLEKDEDLTTDERAAALASIEAVALTTEEEEILAKGVSNAEYHYLGSAKIIACIGKKFAVEGFGQRGERKIKP